MYKRGWTPQPSNILFYPRAVTTLCSRIRLTACTLGICHPRFLCSGAKQTRNSHRPRFPSPPTLCSPPTLSLPPPGSNALRSRSFYTLPFSSRQPSRSPSRPHVLMCDLIRSFFRPTRRLLNCLARCVSLHPVNSAPGKIPLRYTLLRTARKCIRFVTR